MRPARAPASMVMLHTVIRPSIERPRMVLPAYSTTWPVPPQGREGLSARHLADDVRVDVDEEGRFILLVDDVAVPDLVEQRARLAHVTRSPPDRGRPTHRIGRSGSSNSILRLLGFLRLLRL